MGDNSYSYYIRTKPCCSSSQSVSLQGPQGIQGIQGDTGPQGIQGVTGPQAETKNTILYFSDYTSGTGQSSGYLEYDHTTTQNNGIINFMDGNATTSGISFENETLSNSYIEIYAHCDAQAGSSGQDNWIIVELIGSDQETTPIQLNSVSTVDIDTRSVQKGEKLHLSFGPSAYRVNTTTTLNQNLTIHKDNKYRLHVQTGRQYTLTEIKLVIHLRNSV